MSVPVSAVAAIPNKAIAPMGNGLVMIPIMVATKIANRCQARGWTPDGGGISRDNHCQQKHREHHPDLPPFSSRMRRFRLSSRKSHRRRRISLSVLVHSFYPGERKEGPIILPVHPGDVQD